MKKISLSVLSCMLVAMVLFSSCAKDGPAGATGPAGANGAAGPAGPAGPAGTANVIYSAWLDVGYAVDTVHNGAAIDTIGFIANIPAAKMTATIINSGEIRVYWNINSTTNPVVIPLPCADVFNGFFINPFFFITTAGVSTIQLYANDNYGTYTSSGVKYSQYRYILIPGGTTARSVINWNDYAAVKAYLHLTD